jgi:heptosyltransferase-2
MRKDRKALNLKNLNCILVVCLDHIGDLLMTTPFLRELRRNLPYARIILVVQPKVYNLVELCPYTSEVLVYRPYAGERFRRLIRNGRSVYFALKYLWPRPIQIGVLPRVWKDHNNGKLLLYLSGASRRVGYVNYPNRGPRSGFDRFLTDVIYSNTLKHTVEHNLDVIRFMGGEVKDNRLEIWTSEEDQMFVKTQLELHDIHGGYPLIAFCPGARVPERRWPLGKFIELGVWLTNEYHAWIVVIGGKGEETLGLELKRTIGDKLIDLVGQTTLRQTGALLRRCSAYVGNDTGPMHLAAAVGVPVIEICCHPTSTSPLSPHSPARSGPWGVRSSILLSERAGEKYGIQEQWFDRSVKVSQVKEAFVEHLKPVNKGYTKKI